MPHKGDCFVYRPYSNVNTLENQQCSRLNAHALGTKIIRIASVESGSLCAGVLAHAYGDLTIDPFTSINSTLFSMMKMKTAETTFHHIGVERRKYRISLLLP